MLGEHNRAATEDRVGTNDQFTKKLAGPSHEQLGTDPTLILDDALFDDLDYSSLTFAEIRMLIENGLQIPSQTGTQGSILHNVSTSSASRCSDPSGIRLNDVK